MDGKRYIPRPTKLCKHCREEKDEYREFAKAHGRRCDTCKECWRSRRACSKCREMKYPDEFDPGVSVCLTCLTSRPRGNRSTPNLSWD